MYGYGYGAPPPPYGAPPPPYGAPPPPYGAPPPPYGAPPPPYGAPPPPYGAPPPPYGAPPPPYGAPPPPYGAPPAPYGAPPPQPYYSAPQAPSSAAAPAPAPAPAPSSTAPAPAQQPPHTEPPSAPPAPQSQPATAATPSLGGGYPSLHAPQPPQVPPDARAPDGSRPSSASPHPAASAAPGAHSRPASASPATAAHYPYGAPPPNPQQPVAPYTYGQPAAAPYAAAPAAPAYMPPTTYAPAPGHGGRRRRAVLVGCSYQGTSAALNGCLNDVQCIQFCLQQRFGFTEQQMVVLRDDPGRQRDFTSTKANIYRAIQWLMTDQQPGDSLFFHFSGHGSQQYDRNGDEEDGYDETICPSDFRSAGQIVDDELNRMMVRPLLPGVTLHAVIDACHSGTAFDLPFRAKVDGGGRWYWKGRARHDKMTAGGTAFQFGACKDCQVAQDTKALSGKAYTGAATYCFIEAIEKYGTQQTYGQVLSHMMTTLRNATGGSGMGSTTAFIASFLLGPGALGSAGQTPVLSCDKQIDLYSQRLSL